MKEIAIILLGMYFIGCSDDENDTNVKLPSNLEVLVTVSAVVPGLVNVKATAADANYFTILFGDGTIITPQSGEGSHTYTSAGIYTISVRAHATNTDYISADKQVEITLSEGIADTGYSTPDNYEGMTLVWHDEFDASVLNEDDWTFELGTGSNGWGNNELQYYRKENTHLQDGFLIITAKKEPFHASNYTSSRIITKDKQSFQYGRIDIRAKLPKGQGIWPALWMLGSSFPGVNWPACGEIDIMEMIGGKNNDGVDREKTVHGTVHWSDAGGHAQYGGSRTISSGTYSDEFHVYTITWDETYIRWFVDDVQYHVIDITPANLSEFRQKYFFIFNVAVGGNWPGNPNNSTTFPQKLIVDYVRVFQ